MNESDEDTVVAAGILGDRLSGRRGLDEGL